MEKIPSVPAYNTGKNKEPGDELGANPSASSDSERTISADFGGIPYGGHHHDQLEADSGTVFPVVGSKDASYDSDRTCSDGLEQIPECCYSYGLEMNYGMLFPVEGEQEASSHAVKMDLQSASFYVAEPEEKEIPLPHWLKVHPSTVDLDGWKAVERTRSNRMTKDKYYIHKEYDHIFRSRPQVSEFLKTGKVKGILLQKRSADPSAHGQGPSWSSKRRIGASISSPSWSTRGQMAPTPEQYYSLNLTTTCESRGQSTVGRMRATTPSANLSTGGGRRSPTSSKLPHGFV